MAVIPGSLFMPSLRLGDTTPGRALVGEWYVLPTTAHQRECGFRG